MEEEEKIAAELKAKREKEAEEAEAKKKCKEEAAKKKAEEEAAKKKEEDLKKQMDDAAAKLKTSQENLDALIKTAGDTVTKPAPDAPKPAADGKCTDCQAL